MGEISKRVAARWIESKEHDPARISWLYDDVRQLVARIEEALRDPAPSLRTEAAISVALGRLFHHGSQLARWMVETRAIPSGKAKAVELAARALERTRVPRDGAKWWAKNKRHLDTILAAQKWPERSQSSEIEEVFEVGPFTVHNTLHLEDSKLEKVREVLAKATSLIRKAGFSKLLYGPVYIVGRLRRPRVLAWYYKESDDVYLRPHVKVGSDELHNLIHELGHRYWYKFMTPAQRSAWVARHTTMSFRRSPRVELPEPGSPLPISVRGHKENPIIVKYETALDGRIIARLDVGGFISVPTLMRAMEKEQKQLQFPTAYAATDVREHFPEAFAMHVLGTLPPEHEAFWQETMG